MSGNPASGMARAHERGQAAIRQQNADTRMGLFLRKLDASRHDLSAFEMDFIESFLGDRATKDAGLDFQWFTPKRRVVVQGMINKYSVALPLSPIASSPSPVQPLRAEPGTCQYLQRVDGVQSECGAPAVWKGRSRPFLLYCDACGAVAGRSFEIVAIDGSGRSLKPMRLSNRQAGGGL